jgi:lipoprotein-releasing system permease protein
MLQGLCLGVGGTVVGLGLGVVGALYITSVVAWLQQVSHSQWFAAYYVNYLPSEIKLSDLVTIFVAATALSFLGTLYPASRA